MALSLVNLRAAFHGGGLATGTPGRYWDFVTNDLLSAVLAATYFDTAYQLLAAGDVIFARCDLDGTFDFTILRVTASSSSGVTVVEEKIGSSVEGVAAGYKMARGVATITGSGTVVTGLATAVAVVAMMQADASLTNGISVTGTIGDQAGAPAAGSVILKVWKPTGSGDVTPIASAAAVAVNWIAIGT
jgi:hypothetical protein